MPTEWVSGLASCQAKGVSTRNPIAAMPNQSDVRNRPGSRAGRSMSDLIRHARAGLTGLRAGDGVISSTRPPGSGPLLLDIDFASCRAAILGGAAPDPRRGHPGFLILSFLFLLYRIQKRNRYLRRVSRCKKGSRSPRMSPKENDKMCH